MGMDVYGNEPSDEAGEYFRNNVWWWHPLWDYCLDAAPEIAGKVVHGHSNDGDGLNGDDARALAQRLTELLDAGAVAEYEREYNETVANTPRETCEFCSGTGIRRDKVGQEFNMPERPLEDAVAIIVGRTHGWCNACRGEGKVDAWSTNYSFSADNVSDFRDFLEECGGFKIC